MMKRAPKIGTLDLGLDASLLAPKSSEIDDDCVAQSEICDDSISISDFHSELVDSRPKNRNSLMRAQLAKPQFDPFRSETLDPFLDSSPHSSKCSFLLSLTEAQNLNLRMRSRIDVLKEEMSKHSIPCDAHPISEHQNGSRYGSISEYLNRSQNLSNRIRFLITVIKIQMGDYPIEEASMVEEVSRAGEASMVVETSKAVETDSDSECGEQMLKLLLPRFFLLVRSFPLDLVL